MVKTIIAMLLVSYLFAFDLELEGTYTSNWPNKNPNVFAGGLDKKGEGKWEGTIKAKFNGSTSKYIGTIKGDPLSGKFEAEFKMKDTGRIFLFEGIDSRIYERTGKKETQVGFLHMKIKKAGEGKEGKEGKEVGEVEKNKEKNTVKYVISLRDEDLKLCRAVAEKTGKKEEEVIKAFKENAGKKDFLREVMKLDEKTIKTLQTK